MIGAGQKFAGSFIGTVGFSALSGGVGAELTGGDFWKGAGQGAIVGLLNHSMSEISSNKSRGDYLVYDGDQIIWYDSKGNVIDVFPATSGLPGYQNSSYQNLPDKGPVPEGTYTVNLKLNPYRMANIDPNTGETLSGNGIERIPYAYTSPKTGITYEYPGWGTIRARLMLHLEQTHMEGQIFIFMILIRDILMVVLKLDRDFSRNCFNIDKIIYLSK